MRFIKDGPEIPDRLIQAHEEGNVVFFCGAGISYPAGLPGFKGLVDRLFQALGERPNTIEQAAIKEKRFDAAIDLLERRVGNRFLVRTKLRAILTPQNLSNPASIATHQALLTLSMARDGQTRLVTTNFDRIFHTVEPNLKHFVAPWLPIPKKSRWDGIVYLHGLLPEEENESQLNNLVLSSGDFGLAYLTERWASRFVTELFLGYTVCFIGYNIDDPVLRYMLDALSADRLRGETIRQVFAFGSFDRNKEAEQREIWAGKGVVPIMYSAAGKHRLLHRTMHEWANVYRDGITGKRTIIARDAIARPSRIDADGQIGRVLWAITEPSGQPAKVFAELDPPPSVEWLSIFTEPRFSQDDLSRFGIGRSPTVEPMDFSLLKHPTAHANSNWTTLVGHAHAIKGSPQLDNVLIHIAWWIAEHHLDKPEVLGWVIDNGGCLHPRFIDLITRRLRKNDLPRPLVTIWRLVCAGFAYDNQHHFDLYHWKDRFQNLGWDASLRIELRDLLRPAVRFSKPIRWELGERDNNESVQNQREIQIKDYVDWEVTVRDGEHLRHWLNDLKKQKDWSKVLIDSLSDFTTSLEAALTLMAELEGASEISDLSYVHRPSIEDHPQNHSFHPWTLLIELCRDACLATAEVNPDLARIELERWKLARYPIFRRLLFFAATRFPLISISEATTLLLHEDGWWLWSVETQREALRLLVWLAPQLDNDQSVKVCNSIMNGPPRRMFREELEDTRWDGLVNREIWLRLKKFQIAGGRLTSDAEARVDELSSEHPNWHLEPDARDEFPFWMGSDNETLGRDRVVLPRKKTQLVQALATRPTKPVWQEDNWREICEVAPRGAMSALTLLAAQDTWPISVWREALQVFSEEKLSQLSFRHLGRQLLDAPAEVFHELAHTLSWWLRIATNHVPQRPNQTWLQLIDRMLDCYSSDSRIEDQDPVHAAINHPIGHAAEALISWWYRSQPKLKEGLSEPLKIRLARMADVQTFRLPHGRVIMAGHLNSLYLVDPDWTTEKLLPCFDWKIDRYEAKGAWEGYLWSPRISVDLLQAFKGYFLTTSNYYEQLGKHDRQYSSLLTVVALQERDQFTLDELRNAFNALPAKGLAHAADTLPRLLDNAGDQKEEYWSNRVKPFISDIWPKSHKFRSEKESIALARVCIRAGGLFPDAVKQLQPLLRRSVNLDLAIMDLAESDLTFRYPSESLKLLEAIVDEANQWPLDELGKCLEQIRAAEPACEPTSEYQRLCEYLRRLGRS